MFKIYKLNLRSGDIEESLARFKDKDKAMIYCYKLNIASVYLGVTYFFFYYFDAEDSCFNEIIKKEELLLEAKKQISIKIKLIENEKYVLEKANKLISEMEKEAV